MQSPEETDIDASLRNTPLVVPLATESTASPKRGCPGLVPLRRCSEGGHSSLPSCATWQTPFL